MRDSEHEFVSVNHILSKPASLGFVPANQVLPWLGLIVVAYVFTEGMFGLGMPVFLVTAMVLVVSFWLLTGDQPHNFTDTLRSPPGQDWCVGHLRFQSPLGTNRPLKLKPIVVPNQHRGKSRFMPFENETHVCCVTTTHKDNREVGALLLNNGKQYQLLYMFKLAGNHDLLFPNEVMEIGASLEEGMKDLLEAEKFTVMTGCYSDDSQRQAQLSRAAEQSQLNPVSVLMRNEGRRVRQTTASGTRQRWQQVAFCTWTADAQTGASFRKDFLGTLINQGLRLLRPVLAFLGQFMKKISGEAARKAEVFFTQLLLNGFDQGFLRWEIWLNTRLGQEVTICSAQEIWEWHWQRFNQGPVPPIPQLLTLQETEQGWQLTLTETTRNHFSTVLIQGQDGTAACPSHQRAFNRVMLPAKDQQCAVMVMEKAPDGWLNTRQQLRWMFDVMSSPYNHDMEAWVELTVANSFWTQDNLARHAKQSKAAMIRSATKGQGRDVGAEIKQDDSFEAQKRLYKGAKTIHCAIVFLVYRPDAASLNQACRLLGQNFGTARVVRESNIAWQLWLECLPITWKRLLHTSSTLSDRRLTLDTSTVAGVLPLTVPKDIDQTGVEFLTERGGKPVYVNLFSDQTGEATRILIIGEAGSGKSCLGWRFMLQALAQNIPVVGMDISTKGDSTFKTGIELLGDQGAYFNMTDGSSNLMEPPDLRRFDKATRAERMEFWKNFIRKAIVAISMGKIPNSPLAQRVDALSLRAIQIFLSDPEIIARYNAAFDQGWRSNAWQDMPTFKDFLRYVSRERLNLQSFEEIDRQAINQIRVQGEALLVSRVGKAICHPSTFAPDPLIKFFALSDLGNEQDSYLMSLNAYAACIRNALAHPQSMFVGDELSVLLKRDGFADVVGEMASTGRKSGIAMVLISTDLDAIQKSAAGSQILDNMVVKLTGRLTETGVNSWIRLGYSPNIISRNSTEAFRPRVSDLYSCWLIERGGRFWRVRFYPSEMTLASVANNQKEQAARRRIMVQYPKNMRGRLRGLKHFTDVYIPALQEGTDLQTLVSEPPLPPSMTQTDQLLTQR